MTERKLKSSRDLQALERGVTGRIAQAQGFKLVANDGSNHQVAVGFGVGGHHSPRCPWGAGGVEQIFIGLLVRLPLFAHL